jgi:hypothetical protein
LLGRGELPRGLAWQVAGRLCRQFWLEVAKRRGLVAAGKVAKLQDEAAQLARIFNATRVTARSRNL